MDITTLLPWILAAWTSIGLWEAGSGGHAGHIGWVLCLSAQFIWIAFGLVTGMFGFVASGAVHLAVYGRNAHHKPAEES